MARRYIDRDALIAKIEKAIDSPAPSHDQQCDWEDGYWCGLSKAECIIDTLEAKEEVLCVKDAFKSGYDMGVLQTTNKINHSTKEVDLEKEIQETQRNYKTIEEYKGYPCTMYADDIEWIARHFFELGLKAKGE